MLALAGYTSATTQGRHVVSPVVRPLPTMSRTTQGHDAVSPAARTLSLAATRCEAADAAGHDGVAARRDLPRCKTTAAAGQDKCAAASPASRGQCCQWPRRQSSVERSPLSWGAKDGAAATVNGDNVGAAQSNLPRCGVIATTVEDGVVVHCGLPCCMDTVPTDDNDAAAQHCLPGRVASRRNLSKTP